MHPMECYVVFKRGQRPIAQGEHQSDTRPMICSKRYILHEHTLSQIMELLIRRWTKCVVVKNDIRRSLQLRTTLRDESSKLFQNRLSISATKREGTKLTSKNCFDDALHESEHCFHTFHSLEDLIASNVSRDSYFVQLPLLGNLRFTGGKRNSSFVQRLQKVH